MKLKKILDEIRLEQNKWEVIPHNEIAQYEDIILKLIQRTYANIGGNPNFKTPADVRNPKNDYEVLDNNGDEAPEATVVSKNTPAGTKIVAAGHDGQRESIRTILRHKIDLLHTSGYFAEVSGKLKDILLNNGVPVVDDKDVVEQALAGKKIEWHGDGSYTREVGGIAYTKVMVGKPKV